MDGQKFIVVRVFFFFFLTGLIIDLAAGTTGSPSAICVSSGFRGHLVEFGGNILELLVYYLMLNKCKNLKDMKSSCLSVCTSSLYDNEGRYFLHYYM